MSELKLHKAIEIDGKKVDKIEYDLDSITGKDIEDICKIMAKEQNAIVIQETDPIFHAHIFAQAAGIAYEDLRRMNGKDFTKATTLVRDFFYIGSEGSQVETSSGI
ncbi:MAG: phage tail assembly protein [Clostridiales bacterium]|jgi:DNA-binding Xre family transcriptional regulator|nr:phage tail assembly protein [Eubacteriales bacterium]MDH7566857.1 phage tail assembly protein [Clostridiales bacterium]